jgi:membrane protein required for colicin V production
MTELGWVDWTFIAILAVSVVLGLWRGLVLEVLSLLGWLVAYVAGQWFAPLAAPHVPIGRTGSPLNYAAAFACVFIATLIVWALLARLLRFVIHATPLSGVDRVLGATFGAARAIVVMLAITTVVMWTSLAQSQAWRASHGAVWLTGALRGIKPMLPAQLAEHLPR